MTDDTEHLLPQRWLAAAGEPSIATELEAVYALVSDQIEARGPACWASGRCCNFESTGHRLYVTGLEAAYTLLRLGPDQRADLTSLTEARARGGCPFQSGRSCTVHTIKPLGCRTYFCDRSAQEWQHLLTERSLESIRRIHDRHDLPYRYGEWRDMLERFTASAHPAGPS